MTHARAVDNRASALSEVADKVVGYLLLAAAGAGSGQQRRQAGAVDFRLALVRQRLPGARCS